MAANVVTIDDFRALLKKILDQSDLAVAPETTAKDIQGCHSLNRLRLLLRIEEQYGIDLPVGEIEDAENVGELLAIIDRLSATGDADSSGS